MVCIKYLLASPPEMVHDPQVENHCSKPSQLSIGVLNKIFRCQYNHIGLTYSLSYQRVQRKLFGYTSSSSTHFSADCESNWKLFTGNY